MSANTKENVTIIACVMAGLVAFVVFNTTLSVMGLFVLDHPVFVLAIIASAFVAWSYRSHLL